MISVIIPVYNNKDTIRTAICSVLEQEGVDTEVICVDDGSADGTAEVLEELRKESSRVRVIRQENAGPGAARNRGIDEAEGDYIAFVDADDKLLPGALAALQDVMESDTGDADCPELAIAGLLWRRTFPGGETREHDTMESLVRFSGKNRVPERFFELLGENLINSMCGKLYLRSIIDEFGIRVPTELDMGEDLQFNLRYLLHIDSLFVLPRNAYVYENDNSTLSSRYRPDMFQVRKLSVSMLRDYILSSGLNDNICFYLYEKLLIAQTMQDIEFGSPRGDTLLHINETLKTPEIRESIEKFKPEGMLQRAVSLVVSTKRAGLIIVFSRLSSFVRRHASDKMNRVSV